MKGLLIITALALVGPCWAAQPDFQKKGTLVSVSTQRRESYGGSESRDVYVIRFEDCIYTAEGDHLVSPANAVAVPGSILPMSLTGDYILVLVPTPPKDKVLRVAITKRDTQFRVATLLEYEGSQVTEVRSRIGRVRGTAVQFPVFTIQFDDLVYTSTGQNPDDGHDLIVGDKIQGALQGDYIRIKTPSGKELKTRINKIERAPKP